MKKVLYIGHVFHKKTLSTEFFIEILERYYVVDYLLTDRFEAPYDVANSPLINEEYHAVVLFQIMVLPQTLELFTCKNIIIIPMFDNDLNMTYGRWRSFRNYKFINFSKSLYDKLSFLGFKENLYLQYAPEVDSTVNTNDNKKAKLFFWQRGNVISFELFKKLFDSNQIDSVHLHRLKSDSARDPFYKEPSDEDIKRYNLTFSSWFEDKNEIDKKIKECDVFIASRPYEGIGQTFLEAMSYGKCVVSPNNPTMNEYIVDGFNGILFDYNCPENINLSDFHQLGLNAKESIKKINSLWKTKEKEIVEFIDRPSSKESMNSLLCDNVNKLSQKLNQEEIFLLDDLKMGYYDNRLSLLLSKYLNFLHKVLKESSHKKFVVYGAGSGAELILSIVPTSIEYIVDKDSSKNGSSLQNVPIYSLEKLQTEMEKKVVLISVFGRSADIIKDMKQMKLYDMHKFIVLDMDTFYAEQLE